MSIEVPYLLFNAFVFKNCLLLYFSGKSKTMRKLLREKAMKGKSSM